jgi:hypothetical protein
MGLIIEDGRGSGIKAGVNADGQLSVRAVVENLLSHNSQDHGLAFSWASGIVNGVAGATVLLVKNTGDKDLHITEIGLSTEIDTRVVIHLVTANVTLAGDATIVGTNLNTGSSNVADAGARTNETGNSQGAIIWSGEIMAAENTLIVPMHDAVILAKNKSIGVDYVIDVAVAEVTIFGNFDFN